jgi:FG-GAP-like repeat
MNGAQISQAGGIGALPSGWTVTGTGDFDGDGKTDILFHNTSGAVAIWLMNGLQVSQFGSAPSTSPVWSVVGTGDFNGDGMSDILWRDTTDGNIALWTMNGTVVSQYLGAGSAQLIWTIQGGECRLNSAVSAARANNARCPRRVKSSRRASWRAAAGAPQKADAAAGGHDLRNGPRASIMLPFRKERRKIETDGRGPRGGCESKSVTKSEPGETKTVTKENCGGGS